MNSKGYTKDNIHKGNTKIVAGGIDVDGLIRIGDQSTGGDGYVLPAVKGTEGQVLTMNADNTSSFQDSGGTSGRVIKNLYTMIDRNASFSATPQDVYSTGYGSLDLGSIDNFPVGATIHLYTKGTWQTSGGLVPANFSLIINDGEPTSVTFDGPVLSMTNNNQRYFYNDLILQRTGTNQYKFKGTGLTSAGGSGDPATAIFYPASTFSPTTPFTSLDLRFTWTTTNSNFYPLTTTFIVDMILDSSLLITAPPAPTSHTALTDLTAGDSGHTQFALLQGRSGGQILSGGLTNLHNLTLKSHSAGINNIVIKDLNTSFEKNIDMNNNNIDNVFEVNSANTLLLGNSTNDDEVAINPNINSGVIAYASTGKKISLVADGGNNVVNIEPTKTDFLNNIDMTGNDINSVVNINIDDTGRIENTNNGYSLRNSRDGPTDNIFIAPTENIFFKSLNLQSGVNIIFPFPNNQIGHPFIGEKLQVLWVNSINGFTPVGGLFSGTSDSLNVAATTAEISIMPLTFVGVGPAVPPNGFSVGDSFELKLSGPFNSANSDTLTIRLKGGPTATTLLSTLVVPLNASSGSVFQLTVFFQIRAIGGAGVADIISDADLTYNQSGAGGAFVGEQSLSQNNTTFDTTVANILDVTAQFGSASASNDMTTRISKLQKTF